jgi:hypothetical protein
MGLPVYSSVSKRVYYTESSPKRQGFEKMHYSGKNGIQDKAWPFRAIKRKFSLHFSQKKDLLVTNR